MGELLGEREGERDILLLGDVELLRVGESDELDDAVKLGLRVVDRDRVGDSVALADLVGDIDAVLLRVPLVDPLPLRVALAEGETVRVTLSLAVEELQREGESVPLELAVTLTVRVDEIETLWDAVSLGLRDGDLLEIADRLSLTDELNVIVSESVNVGNAL